MKSSRLVIALSLIFITITCVFCYLTSNKQHPIYVVLQLENTSNTPFLQINQTSLKQLEKVINDNMIVKDQSKLLDVFNQEKSSYVNLITIISILLTVFSLFTALSAFVEKNELNKISNDMALKINEYKEELKNIYFNTLISYIQRIKSSYTSDKILYLDDGKPVNDYPQFLKLININLNSIFEYVVIKELSEKLSDKGFFVEYYNLTVSIIDYASCKDYISQKALDVNNNEVFRCIINSLYSNIGKKRFEEFKTLLNSSMTINWGSY